MVDDGLAVPCTDGVGVANFVGALWSMGGCLLLRGKRNYILAAVFT